MSCVPLWFSNTILWDSLNTTVNIIYNNLARNYEEYLNILELVVFICKRIQNMLCLNSQLLCYIELFMFDIQNKIKCRGYITMNGRNGQKRYTVVVV